MYPCCFYDVAISPVASTHLNYLMFFLKKMLLNGYHLKDKNGTNVPLSTLKGCKETKTNFIVQGLLGVWRVAYKD
jgi:hypothetical protein